MYLSFHLSEHEENLEGLEGDCGELWLQEEEI